MGSPDRDIAQAKDFIAPPGYLRHRPEVAESSGFSLVEYIVVGGVTAVFRSAHDNSTAPTGGVTSPIPKLNNDMIPTSTMPARPRSLDTR